MCSKQFVSVFLYPLDGHHQHIGQADSQRTRNQHHNAAGLLIDQPAINEHQTLAVRSGLLVDHFLVAHQHDQIDHDAQHADGRRQVAEPFDPGVQRETAEPVGGFNHFRFRKFKILHWNLNV